MAKVIRYTWSGIRSDGSKFYCTIAYTCLRNKSIESEISEIIVHLKPAVLSSLAMGVAILLFKGGFYVINLSLLSHYALILILPFSIIVYMVLLLIFERSIYSDIKMLLFSAKH